MIGSPLPLPTEAELHRIAARYARRTGRSLARVLASPSLIARAQLDARAWRDRQEVALDRLMAVARFRARDRVRRATGPHHGAEVGTVEAIRFDHEDPDHEHGPACFRPERVRYLVAWRRTDAAGRLAWVRSTHPEADLVLDPTESVNQTTKYR